MVASAVSPDLRPGSTLVAGWQWRLLTLFACAIVAHFLFSPLGFNLTDDGFVLAQSRRILAGEIPHRDFISIRPAGSAYLHVVDLVLGGEHTFLVSRLIYWLEVALVCWVWLEISIDRNGLRPSLLGTLPYAMLSFMLSTHAFPAMAWYTVDGILLASLGALFGCFRGRVSQLVGYGLIGAAAVCKQNFIAMVPLAVVLKGDAHRPWAWVAGLFVPMLYVLAMTALGAGHDMHAQLTAVTEVFESGLKPYMSGLWFPAGILSGGVLTTAVLRHRLGTRTPRAAVPWIALVLAWSILAFAAEHMDANNFQFIDHYAFVPLGMTVGALVVSLGYRRPPRVLQAEAFVVALGWCSGISIGYLTPAHVSGPVVTSLTLGMIGLFDERLRARALQVGFVCAAVAVLLVAPHWWSARRDHINHESTAPLLTRDLGGVLPGGMGIRTDDSTYAMLADLRLNVDRLNGRPYAILVDGPGWWACAAQRNPLPTDWPQSMELCTKDLQTRLTGTIMKHRGRTAVLVQKASAANSSEGFFPIGETNFFYGAAVWAIRHLHRESETRYWAVYR
ncbi:MAG: hypothetical protein HYR74_03435 [Candidatus Eisenbacteria bacterium]|nr:hypothetical protein [Candidatus Eisenbacteria bacterium]